MCLCDNTAVFYSTLILVRFYNISISWRHSYQTGIHRKAAARPEHAKLPSPKGHHEAGEKSTGHQVEESRLPHLHQCQGNKGHKKAYAICWKEKKKKQISKNQLFRYSFAQAQLNNWLKEYSYWKFFQAICKTLQASLEGNIIYTM